MSAISELEDDLFYVAVVVVITFASDSLYVLE